MSYSRYCSARNFISLLQFVVMVGAALGLVLAVVGFASGELLGSHELSGSVRYRGTPLSMRLLSTVPGAALLLTCLYMYAQCASMRASIDTAELTAGILVYVSNGAFKGDVHNLHQERGKERSTTVGSGLREYRGLQIIERDRRYYVGEEQFFTLARAEEHIDKLVER